MPESSEQPNIIEEQNKKIEKSKDKRARVYLEIISSPDNNDEKLLERQRNILKELPDIKNLSRLLKAGLKANAVEFPNSQTPDRLIVQGILFEELVKIENSIYNLSSNQSSPKEIVEKYDDIEKGRIEVGLDEQLTTLFHNPDRYNYQELSHLRNPDISFVETDINGKTLKVIGVGEAKSSFRLDRRCLSQFSYFHKNLNKVANFINEREDCDQHGLKHFGKGVEKTTIKVNEKEQFNQYLIVTHDINIDISNPKKYFKTKGYGALSDKEQNVFENMIQTGKIKIIKSSFSHQDLDLLVAKIEKEISEEIRIEMEELQAEQESL